MATLVLILLVIGGLFWVFKLFNDGTIGNVGRLLGVLMILLGAGAYYIFCILDRIQTGMTGLGG